MPVRFRVRKKLFITQIRSFSGITSLLFNTLTSSTAIERSLRIPVLATNRDRERQRFITTNYEATGDWTSPRWCRSATARRNMKSGAVIPQGKPSNSSL